MVKKTLAIGFCVFILPGFGLGAVLGSPLSGFAVAMCLYSMWGMAVYRNYNEHATLPWSHYQHDCCAPARWGSMTSNDYGAIMRRDGVGRREPLMIVFDGGNYIAPQWVPSEPLRIQQPQMQPQPVVAAPARRTPARQPLPEWSPPPGTEHCWEWEPEPVPQLAPPPEPVPVTQGMPVWLVAEAEPEAAAETMGRPSLWDYSEVKR